MKLCLPVSAHSIPFLLKKEENNDQILVDPFYFWVRFEQSCLPGYDLNEDNHETLFLYWNEE